MTGGPGDAPLVLPLAEVGEAPLALVGGKARGLGQLLAGGFPVPEGVVATAPACQALLAAAGLAGARTALAHRLAAAALPDEEAWLADCRSRLAAAEVPAEVAAALRAAAGPLLDGRLLAVRSSGSLEDLDGASFAGQYESFLGVRGDAAALQALSRCVASLFTPRLAAYLRRRGAVHAAPAMAVVVQRQVAAEAAGVLFTVDPTTGREDHAVVEAVFGLADAMVSGTAPADRLVVDLPARVIVARHPGAVPPPGRAGPVLDDAAALELVALGAAVQEHLGFPVDVEWTRAQGRLELVQARPITSLHFAEALGEWTTADLRDGGVSADVCLPLMWSLYEAAFEASMPRYLGAIGLIRKDLRATWLRMFFGRPYWNLGESRAAVMKLPGFVERNFDHGLGIEPTYEGPGRVTPTNVRTVLPALAVLLKLHLEYRRRRRDNARFLAAFPGRSAPLDLAPASLGALDDAALAAGWGELLALHLDTETAYFETIYNTTNARMDFKVAFAAANARAAPPLDDPALMGGLEDLSHVRTLVDLHRTLGALRRAGAPLDDATVAAFALRWPHRSRRELELRTPRWPEDLPFVRGFMAQALETWREEDDPVRVAADQRAAAVAERERALAGLRGPVARATFRSRLRRLRFFAWEREEMRDRSSRVYALARRWALEAGRRLTAAGALADPEDVFVLRREEVASALAGRLAGAALRDRIRAGWRAARSFRNFQNPNEIGATHAHAPAAPAPDGAVLRGAGCSHGRARGPARVVRRIEEAGRLRPGDVLVAHFTDPGWTTFFPRLGAVVTETGGLLSHAAVIARECGIPAVLAVPNATRAIPDGALVEVDGAAGTVTLVEPVAPAG